MNGRIAIMGSSSEAPSETLTASGALACSSVLLASSWNNGGTAHRKGTTASSSSTSVGLSFAIFPSSQRYG